jgi:hypothetical protein
MSDRTEVLSRQATEAREELSAALDALEREIGAATDWRAYVRREPMMTLGIAALGGAIIGAASAPRRSSRRSSGTSALLHAGEAVVGGAASAALLKRVGGFVLDLVVTRVLDAYKAETGTSIEPRATSEPARAPRTARPRETSQR